MSDDGVSLLVSLWIGGGELGAAKKPKGEQKRNGRRRRPK